MANNSIFLSYPYWKKIVRDKILDSEKQALQSYCETHTEMQIAGSCLAIVTPFTPGLSPIISWT